MAIKARAILLLSTSPSRHAKDKARLLQFIEAQALPADAQNALLQIVELLAQNPVAEDEEWSRFSLSSAMNVLEEESCPDYTSAPNFQKWQ